MDKFTQYAMVASDEAIADSSLDMEEIDKLRVGVIWGAGIGGLETFQNEAINFGAGDGTPRFNPFFIPKMIADIAPGNISIKNGFMGPNYTTVSACASSANAMIDALNYIRLGTCDVIVTGGSEAAVVISGVGGFNAMHALSTRNETPETASRPFDSERDGFVLGEGAGAIVLEEYEHAKARGAKIYAEVIGGGMSSWFRKQELTSLTLVTTCLAAAAGGVVAALVSFLKYKNLDLTMFLNGILGGLVGITAGADVMTPESAIIIGAIAGTIIVFAVAFVDAIKLDDPVGAIAVHLICGIWGTLAVGLFSTNPEHTFLIQLTGVACYAAFCIITSFLIIFTLKKTIGIRVSEKEELEGLDSHEHGMDAYSDFRLNEH